jgi:hypothetical protein
MQQIIRRENVMAKLKKGQEMVCIPCAREVVISNAGASITTLWCCGRPMKEKSKAGAKKKTTSKTTVKKITKKATKK